MRNRIVPAVLLAWGVFVGNAAAADPVGSPADPFLCYKAITPPGGTRFDEQTVLLSDGFESLGFEVQKPDQICSPADVGGEGVVDATTHLERYKIRAVTGSPKHVKQTGIRVLNQFGTIRVDTIKPDLLMVPAGASTVSSPPAPLFGAHGVDHYKCYKVKVTKGTAKFAKGVQRTVADSLVAVKTFDVKTPKHLCTPVSEDLQPIKNPSGHLLCYIAKPAKGQPKHVPMNGLFTHDLFWASQLDTKTEKEICVPSIINPVCGDGVLNDGDEDCDGADDDACPGKCTSLCACPTAHPFVIDPAASQITVRGALGLNSTTPLTGLSGTFSFDTGGQSQPGVYEVSIPIAALPPLDVAGLATACVFLVEDPNRPGSGVSGSGILNCAGSTIPGQASPDLGVHIDHCTNGTACDSYPVGNGCVSPLGFGGKIHSLTGACVPEGPPDASCTATDEATGTSANLEGASDIHPGVCQSPLYGVIKTTPWSAGDAFVTVNVAVDVRGPGDLCAGPPTSAPILAPLTTGTVLSTIMDAFPSTAGTGKVQALQMDGTPFNCSALLDSNNADGAALVATFAALDQDIFGLADLNVGLVLTAQ